MTLIIQNHSNIIAIIISIVAVNRKMLFQRHLAGPHCRPHLEQVHILKTAEALSSVTMKEVVCIFMQLLSFEYIARIFPGTF